MKKQLKKKIVLFLICLFLFVFEKITSIPCLAENINTKSAVTESNLIGSIQLDENNNKIEADTVPEIVGYEYAVAQNHIKRLYQEEGCELNKLIFLNSDDSRTMYLYDFPVKYIDSAGNPTDISLEIDENRKNNRYETVAGLSISSFPKKISDGIRLEGNGETIILIPQLPESTMKSVNSTGKLIDKRRVSYFYDENTSLEYSLTYTGFKENIIVNEYTGQSIYNFILYTNGLRVINQDNAFCLTDKSDNVKGILGDVIIFTADEKNNTNGILSVQSLVESQEYLITIEIDPEFLKDEKTIYPICIDPTLEICYDNYGSGAIADVTINSKNSSSNGLSGSLSVGLGNNNGIARILMKFPGLDLDSLGNNLNITNATVELRDLMCEATELNVSCYVFSGNEWNESTANWSNVNPNSYSTFLSSNTISYANGRLQPKTHRYSFDITQAVVGWKLGTCNPEKGILFKGSSTVEYGNICNNKTIASYNRSSNRPTLSLTYSTSCPLVDNGIYYINNKYHGKYLRRSNSSIYTSSGLIVNLQNSVLWEFCSVGRDYVIRFKDDPTKYLSVPTDTTSSSVSIVTITDSAIPARCKWYPSVAYNGEGLLLKNVYNSRYLYEVGNYVYTATSTGTSGTSTYRTRVWRTCSENAMSRRELNSETSFDTIMLSVGNNASPTIRKNPSNAFWSDSSDFIYSIIATPVSVSENTFTGISSGTTTVVATHKVTNRQFVFAVVVGNRPHFSVTNYLDQGYWVLFESNNVTGYCNAVSTKFNHIYGLNMTHSVNSYTSIADTCKINQFNTVQRNNLTKPCITSPSHLTAYQFLYNGVGNGTSIATKVQWTGHLLDNQEIAWSYRGYNTVVVTSRNTSVTLDSLGGTFPYGADVVRRRSIDTLMHELSHELGARDHYCYGNGNPCTNENCDIHVYNRPRVRNCLMSETFQNSNIEATNDAILYCSDCLSIICNHLNNHH